MILNPMAGTFTGTEEDTQSHTQRRSCEHGGRDGSDAAINQGIPAAPEAGRDKEVFSSRAFRESKALLTPGFQTASLQNCERITFSCFKPPCL